MASTYLVRTPSSAGNRKTWSFNFWVKRGSLGGSKGLFGLGSGAGVPRMYCQFENDKLIIDQNQTGNSWNSTVTTNRLFRDVNAWYNILVVLDTTQATASDRVKIYVNGVQETSFSSSSYPSQNADMPFNNNSATSVGSIAGTNSNLFDGSMSHIHFTDGYAYAASDFGSTDSTTGEWKINTSPSVTYGTNGFFLLKDDNAVTDRSGQGNNYTLGGGTLTKTEDCPDNVFATMNSLDKNTNVVLTNGNTTSYMAC